MATRTRKPPARKATATRAPSKAKAKPSAEVMTVTPEQATAWLEGNVHNRALRQRRVDDLAAAIQRGEWQLNGDAIRFDANGTLLDGQHRLWAIALAETPVESLVIRGLERGSQETMDMGARRNLGDVLRLRGHSNPMNLAAAVAYWWRYENGYVRVPTARPSIPQALQVLEDHPTLPEVVADTWQVVRRFRIPQGPASAAWYEFHSIDSERADAFFESLTTGAALPEGSPILALRRWLERRASGEQAGGVRADAVVVHALFVKAWNAYRAGHPVDRLSWKATGMKAEGFPEAE
jgi:anti-sigma28 factor (negative regulator of flagellin synthesis)